MSKVRLQPQKAKAMHGTDEAWWYEGRHSIDVLGEVTVNGVRHTTAVRILRRQLADWVRRTEKKQVSASRQRLRGDTMSAGPPSPEELRMMARQLEEMGRRIGSSHLKHTASTLEHLAARQEAEATPAGLTFSGKQEPQR